MKPSTIRSSFQVRTLLVIATFLTFFRAFTAQYVNWDDPVLVLDNPLLKLPFFEALPIFFTSFYHGDYMPLTLISYRIEVALFGFNPFASHFVNLMLHLGCGMALFEFLRSMRLSVWLKDVGIFLILAIFLLHPMQVETVMWVSERKGLLSSFFLLFAMIASQRAEQGRTGRERLYLGLYYFSFLAALLAKATGVFIPVLLILMEGSSKTPLKRGVKKEDAVFNFWFALRKHAIPCIMATLIVAVRIVAYGGDVSNLFPVFFDPERWLLLPLRICSVLGFYVVSFFNPFFQSIIYPEFRLDGDLVIRLSAICVFVFAVFVLWTKKRKREILFFTLFSLVLLLPILQIVPRINLVSDRYMYMPIIGLAGLTAIFLDHLSKRTFKNVLFFTVLILGTLSCFRSRVWNDDASLWTNAIETASWSGLARNNYAMALERQGQVQAAVTEFEKALILGKRDGTDNLAYNNLGVVYAKYPKVLDQHRAIEYFEKGIAEAQRPEDRFTLRLNLAKSYAAIGQHSKANGILIELEKELDRAARDKKYLELLWITRDLIKKI